MLGGPLGPALQGKMAMLDDYREAFGAALIRLSYSINTTSDAELDQALAMLEEQKPLLRKYTSDEIADLKSGNVWLSHAWSGDVAQVTADKDTVKYILPAEGGIRGSDAMVLLASAQHPVAAHLFINHMLDAADQRRQHELHLLHGSQRGREAVHRSGDPRGPDREPGQGDAREAPGAARPGAGPGEVPGAMDQAAIQLAAAARRPGA